MNTTTNYSTIGEVVHLIRNGINVKQHEEAVGYPITRIETISDGNIDLTRVKYAQIDIRKIKEYLMQEGDILFSHINSTEHIGKTAIYNGTPKVLIHGINLLLLRPKTNIIYPKYLLLYLKSQNVRKYFSTRCKKAVNQSSLNQKDIKNVKILLPPLPTQRKIAAILEKAEAAMQKRKEANKLTDEFLKSVFLDMFGDPGRNPKGWKRENISNNTVKAKTINPLKTPNKHFKYIDISSVNNLSKTIDNVKGVIGTEAPSRARQVVNDNDVLVSTVRPNLNAVAMVPDNLHNQIASTGFCVLRANQERLNPNYLFEITKSQYFISSLTKIAKGASYPAVSDGDIFSLEIPTPPVKLQNKFGNIVTNVEKLKNKQKVSEQELNNLFNSLMQRAFSGELV